MVRSDKSAAEAGTPNGEGEEIDRIMKEIEDLEKKMDAPAEQQPEAQAAAQADSPADTAQGAKVVQMRPAQTGADTLAETDAVPAPDEPLFKEQSSSAGDGGLSMKIGGCTEVSLEFSRAGMSVTLSCNDEALTISTDQGAEFRIPFKRS